MFVSDREIATPTVDWMGVCVLCAPGVLALTMLPALGWAAEEARLMVWMPPAPELALALLLALKPDR